MNGNITEEIHIQNIDTFHYQEIYDELISIFTKINFENYTEELVKSVLMHFNGHLNLSLRYILNNN